MSETRRLLLAVIAIVFLAITAVTWAGVTGPGTTGAEPTTTTQAPAPEPTLVPEAPPAEQAPPAEELPPATSEVPEAPPFEEVARDLGERGKASAPAKAGDEKPAKAPKAAKGSGADWKAAKKAAKAECKRLYTGRERGQCISAAARAHKNPKARGRR